MNWFIKNCVYNIDYLSLSFYVLFVGVLFLYWFLERQRKYVLLGASLFFYLANGWHSLLMVLYMAVFSFISSGKKKSNLLKTVCILCIICPLLLVRMVGVCDGLSLRNIGTISGFLSCVGVSYTALMAIGYIIESDKGKCERPQFVDYLTFLTFFPYALAGPIEKASNMCEQIKFLNNKKCDKDYLERGMMLILYGLFAKLVVADRIGILTNGVFDNYMNYIGMELVTAVVLYGVEIYCDFMACSNIAIGLAMCFGIKIINNFEQPYFSKSISEFWRRWHISLSMWLREYIYIPLGGNRKGLLRQYVNLLITFIVSALWHGFGLNFIVWGVLHGLYQIVEKSTLRFRNSINSFFVIRDTFCHRIFRGIMVFIMVDFAWLFFRVENVGMAYDIIVRIVKGMDPSFLNRAGWLSLGLGYRDWNVIVVGVMMILVIDLINYNNKSHVVVEKIVAENLFAKLVVYVGLLLIIVVYGIYGAGFSTSGFIYRGF